jgi:hypothetical protein
VNSQKYFIEVYEIVFKAKIELDELVTPISIFTRIDSDYISSEDIFLTNIVPSILSIGIRLQYQSRDFKTWAELCFGNHKLSNTNFVELALFLSKELETDVSISNPSHPEYPNPTEIIIYPDGLYQKAYLSEEEEEEEEYINVLEIQKKQDREKNDKNNISELILELENIESKKTMV